MGLPAPRDARRFYRVAKQRLDDALFLLDGKRTNAAIYLGGYAVECILKALIVVTTPTDRRTEIVESFRGARAHSLDWLRDEYRQRGGPGFPPTIAQAFQRVRTWGTHWRYEPGGIPLRDAQAFLKATDELLQWADGRL